ncbi:hypothetical protein EMCRGX_G032358 [Ephydatia muelleri]|eukprot:Em0019g329a
MENYVKLDFDAADVTFALRQHHPDACEHGKSYSSQQAKQEALNSPRLQRTLEEVAAESSRELKDVQKEAQELLEEIGHKMALPAVRSLALVLRSVLRRILKGIFVNKPGLEKLKEAVRQWPVVLLPSHRSYLDFILVTYLMFEHNITLPSIAAGQDFMSMAGVSGLLRRSGAFFLRRTFGSDKLYKAVFTAYVQTLLCSGDSPIEFFIEGTRSRTAKSLHPKYGLMNMIVEPYLDGRVPDVVMIPIGISYERTLEEELFARELLGVPKPKESTGALLRARTLLSENYGSIIVNIGSPVSLHDLCQSKGISRIPHVLYPRDYTMVFSGEREMIVELGHMVIHRTYHCMVVYPSTLMASAVLYEPSGVPLGELVSIMEWLRRELEERGVAVYWEGDNTVSLVHSSLQMHSACVELAPSDIVQPRTYHLTSKLATPSDHTPSIVDLLGMALDSSELHLITEISYMHLMLAHYRNQLMFALIPEAMVALSMYRFLPCNKVNAVKRFDALHCALYKEFVLPKRVPTQMFEDSIHCLLDRGVVVSQRPGDYTLNPQKEHVLAFLESLVLPFVAGVWVVCHHLLSMKGGVQSVSATVHGAKVLAAKCVKAGVVRSYETLSLDLIRNALQSLTEAGLIMQHTSEVEGRDRLVKVDDLQGLQQLTRELEVMVGTARPSRAKL